MFAFPHHLFVIHPQDSQRFSTAILVEPMELVGQGPHNFVLELGYRHSEKFCRLSLRDAINQKITRIQFSIRQVAEYVFELWREEELALDR